MLPVSFSKYQIKICFISTSTLQLLAIVFLKNMKAQILIISILGVFIIGGCESKNEHLAGVKHFYFELIDNVQSEYTIQLTDHIMEILPQYDYLISEETANLGWPFYGPVERGSKVLKTDMMPPHTNVNRLSPINSLVDYNKGEHSMKAVFTIEYKDEATINIIKESFEWSNGNWHKFSKKLSTDFNIVVSNKDETFRKVSKTLIRYTFK